MVQCSPQSWPAGSLLIDNTNDNTNDTSSQLSGRFADLDPPEKLL
jgi:hypothetical protein